MLQIHCPEELREEIQLARKNGSLPSLREKLRYLSHYAEEQVGPVVAHIHPDPYDHCFGVHVAQAATGESVLIGGLIHHDHDQTWGVHT